MPEKPKSALAALSFTLPLPPSINEQYATVGGRRVSSVVARRFKQQVHALLQSLQSQDILSAALLATLRESFLALYLDFYFTTPLKRDLDGGLKITLDAICESLDLNDNRVVDIHLSKHIDPLHPHLYAEIEALPNWQFDKEYDVIG